MTTAIGMLIFAIAGITGLFTLKNFEEKSGHVFFPRLRALADRKSLELKALLVRMRAELENAPQIFAKFSRIVVHDLALGFAAFARWLEGQAHRLADMVGHKHRFERRESRNEFLRRVGEPKNGNGGNGFEAKL